MLNFRNYFIIMAIGITVVGVSVALESYFKHSYSRYMSATDKERTYTSKRVAEGVSKVAAPITLVIGIGMPLLIVGRDLNNGRKLKQAHSQALKVKQLYEAGVITEEEHFEQLRRIQRDLT